jgi:hypothetical protein
METHKQLEDIEMGEKVEILKEDDVESDDQSDKSKIIIIQ